jgi:molybdopterin converting factor subunit 1
VHVNIRLFARLKEVVGASELPRAIPDGCAAVDAWNALVAEFPALADYSRSVSCAVNEEYARLTAPLHDGDEIAFLPPVSGGSGRIRDAGYGMRDEEFRIRDQGLGIR